MHHGSRAVLHGGLAVVAVLALSLPPNVLRKAGVVVPLAGAGGLLLAAVAVGLVPVPAFLLRIVSPTVAEARTGFSWWTLSLDPERTVGELTHLLLPLGFAVLVAVWGVARHRRRPVEMTIAVGTLLVVSVGLAHVVAGESHLFGWIPTSVGDYMWFWAPFIGPNLFGSALLLGLPLATAVCLDDRRPRSIRIAGLLGVVVLLGVLWLVRSSGALVGAAVAMAVTCWTWGLRGTAVAALAVTGLGGAASWAVLGDPNATLNLWARLAMWAHAARLGAGAWLAGVGGGTFGLAVQPGHTDFNLWSHAHHDYLEWAVETGLIGVVAAAVAAWMVRPGESRKRRRSLPISIAVLAVGVHALVDFPLQIPFLAMAVAGLYAVRRSVHEDRTTVSPALVRGLLAVLAVLQLAAGAWELRSRAVTAAVEVLHAEQRQRAAQQTLERLAPWRPELGLAEGWHALAGGEREVAVQRALAVADAHPHDAAALRRAGALLIEAGDPEAALAVLDRSVARFPGDWRTSVVRARATPLDTRWQAWVAAFEAGAPPGLLEEAWASLPEGLVWVNVAEARDSRFAQYVGGFLIRHDQPDAALLAFDHARRVDPDIRPHPGHIKLLLERGRLAEAGALARLGGNDPRFLVLQAEVLEASGHVDEALDLWRSAARQAPVYSALVLRAVERHRGIEAAIAQGESLREADALDPRAVIELARLYRDDGQPALCRLRLDRGGVLEHRSLGAFARRTHASCARSPEAEGSAP